MFDAFLTHLAFFHFLRPWWLLALIPVALFWWFARPRPQKPETLSQGLAPHLARALTVGLEEGRRFAPADLLALVLGLLVLAASGPAWSRADNPLLAQTAPLVVAMKVTPSMQNTDVQPSRHKRASFKILDLIERRAGARTALVAYAGSAHRVTPLTEDPNIIRSYLAGLAPEVMPSEGDRADQALALSLQELGRADTPGAVLFVLDDFNPANLAAFSENAGARAPVIFLVVAPEAMVLPQLADVQNASVVRVTADDADLDRIERRVLSAYREALLEDSEQDWNDMGWLLAWPVLLLMLPMFRRGWTVQGAVALALLVPSGTPVAAADWKGWFLTADQQGQIAYNDNRFGEAADLFQNPEWRAQALLRAGRYEEAAEAFGFLETANGAIGEGIALLRNRKYRDGVRAFEKALERDPGNAAAAANLEVARAIVDFVETQQAQSDTGEEAGIGADDTVFDNESGQGAETEISAEEAAAAQAGLSTEDWMRAVDTQVGDFLASRFRLENTEGGE